MSCVDWIWTPQGRELGLRCPQHGTASVTRWLNEPTNEFQALVQLRQNQDSERVSGVPKGQHQTALPRQALSCGALGPQLQCLPLSHLHTCKAGAVDTACL